MEFEGALGGGAEVQRAQGLELKVVRKTAPQWAWFLSGTLMDTQIAQEDISVHMMGLGMVFMIDPLAGTRPYAHFGVNMASFQDKEDWEPWVPYIGGGVYMKGISGIDWKIGGEILQFQRPNDTINILKISTAVSIQIFTDNITMADRREDVFYDPRLLNRSERKLNHD